MIRNFTKPAFLILALLITCLGACKKKSADAGPTNPEQPGTTIDATPQKSTYDIFELVTINLTEPLTSDQLTITVGGKETVMVKTGDKQYQFLLPVLPVGTHEVKIAGMLPKNKINVTVNSYTQISNPNTEINAFMAKTDVLMDSLNHHGILDTTGVSARLSKHAGEFAAQLRKLISGATEAEKLELAYRMRLIIKTNPSLYGFSSKTGGLRVQNGDEIIQRLKKLSEEYLAGSIVATGAAATTGVTAVIALIDPTRVTVGIASVSAIATCFAVDYARNKGAAIGGHQSILTEINKDYPENEGNSVNMPGLQVNQLRTTATGEAPVKFTSSAPTWILFKGKFRNITQGDINMPVAGEVLKSEKEYLAEYNKLPAQFAKLRAVAKQWLDEVPSVFDILNSQFPTSARFKNAPLDLNYLAISNVSNSDITLTATIDGAKGWKITATNPAKNIKEPVDFTFRVVYTQRDIGNLVSAIIPATFRSTVDSVALLKAKVWRAYEVFDIDPETKQQSCNQVNSRCNIKGFYNVFKRDYDGLLLAQGWAYYSTTAGALTYTFTDVFHNSGENVSLSGYQGTQILDGLLAGNPFVITGPTTYQYSYSRGAYRVLNSWLEVFEVNQWRRYAKIKTLNATDLELEFYYDYNQSTWSASYSFAQSKYLASVPPTSVERPGYKGTLAKVQRFR